MKRLLCIAALLVASSAAPAQRQDLSQRFDPAQEVGIDQRIGERVPLELVLHDHTGAERRLGELFGEQPVLLAFVYYRCPMLCTLVLNGVTSALRTLPLRPGADFQLVVVSIAPDETPELAAEKRAAYLASLGLAEDQPGWNFLVGDRATIDALAGAVGFRFVFDAPSGEYAHASGVQVLTPEGVLARYFYGVEYSARDLRLGLVEASAGKLGGVVDEVLLLCFAYDPLTGKYGLAILTTLRVVGSGLVLALAVYIALMLRRERRRRPDGRSTPPRARRREAH